MKFHFDYLVSLVLLFSFIFIILDSLYMVLYLYVQYHVQHLKRGMLVCVSRDLCITCVVWRQSPLLVHELNGLNTTQACCLLPVR